MNFKVELARERDAPRVFFGVRAREHDHPLERLLIADDKDTL